MDRAELLHATINFSVADHNYVQLILDTCLGGGQFNPAMTRAQLKSIREAKTVRDQLEREMYALWKRDHIGQ